MNSIYNKSFAFQLHPASSIYKKYIHSISQTIKVTNYGSMYTSTCSCLSVLFHNYCKPRPDSKLDNLKKELLQADISIMEEQRQQRVLNKCPKGISIKQHFNTAEDHHRQLYEKFLLYCLFGHKIHRLCKKAYQFPRLYETLRKECYFQCCINFCKGSLLCELAVLKVLKRLLGGSLDFQPLKRQVNTHYCHCIQLANPPIRLEAIVSIGSISRNLDGLLSNFCRIESQPPPQPRKQTHYQANLPSKFAIDPKYVQAFNKEDQGESEEQELDYWQNHFQLAYKQNLMLLKKRNMFDIVNAKQVQEEMREKFDQMQN